MERRVSNITVTNTEMLTAALNSAHAGDTILLAAGTYSGLAIKNVNINGTVKITSLDAGHPASLTNFQINNSSGLSFSHLDFSGLGSDSAAFRINGSNHISFDSVTVHGSRTGNLDTQPNGFGFDGSYISFTNSVFDHVGHGLVFNADHVTITGNTFHDIRCDGIDGGNSSNVLISSNTFTDFYPTAIDHPDAMQFSTSGATASAHDIVITDNVVTRGAGAKIQGIFFKDDSGKLPVENLSITDNTLIGTGFNGIYVSGAANLTISGNNVESIGGHSDLSWIRTINVDGATISNNMAGAFVSTTTTHVVSTANTVLAPALSALIAAPIETTAPAPVTPAPVTPAPVVPAPVAHTPVVAAPVIAAATVSHVTAPTFTGTAHGNDVFHVTHTTDTIVVAAGTPNETVMTSVSYSLPAHVQNMTGTGSADLFLTGNSMDNVITPNAGSDTLTGGAGNDTFVFTMGQKLETITDFKANGDHDRIDISAYVKAGEHPAFVQHGSYVTVDFGGGHSINVLGLHVADMHVSGNYIV